MESGIIHILRDSGFNGSMEWIPLEGKRGNEELIGANKITRRLFDLCGYILQSTSSAVRVDINAQAAVLPTHANSKHVSAYPQVVRQL